MGKDISSGGNQRDSLPSNFATPTNVFSESDKPPYFYVPRGVTWVRINEKWSMRLIEVTSDNRCPRMVVCEVAGNATAKVEFSYFNGVTSTNWYETFAVEGANRFPPPDGPFKKALLRPLSISIKNEKQPALQITMADLRPYALRNFFTNLEEIPYTALFLIEGLK